MRGEKIVLDYQRKSDEDDSKYDVTDKKQVNEPYWGQFKHYTNIAAEMNYLSHRQQEEAEKIRVQSEYDAAVKIKNVVSLPSPKFEEIIKPTVIDTTIKKKLKEQIVITTSNLRSRYSSLLYKKFLDFYKLEMRTNKMSEIYQNIIGKPRIVGRSGYKQELYKAMQNRYSNDYEQF